MKILIYEKIKLIFNVITNNFINMINFFNFFDFIFIKLKKKEKFKVKVGLDTTFKSIHIGHVYYLLKLVNISKLNLFVKFLIIIGLKTSFVKNFKLYNNFLKNSIYILYNIKYFFNKSKIMNIYYNSDWIGVISNKDTTFLIVIRNLNSFFNIKKYNYKIKNFHYILIQSYDTLFLKSEIEIGGFDQKINFLFCYNFLNIYFKKFQFYLLFPILLKNEHKKISKKNNIFFFDTSYFKNKIIYKIKDKNIFYNYIKLLILKNYNFFQYFKTNFNIFENKLFIINNLLNKYFKNFFLKISNIKKFFYINMLFSMRLFKTFFLIFIKKKALNNLKLNRIILLNKDFCILKGNYLLNLNNKYIYIYIK